MDTFLQKVDAADNLRGSGGEGRSLRAQSYRHLHLGLVAPEQQETECVGMKPLYCIASAPSLLEFNDS